MSPSPESAPTAATPTPEPQRIPEDCFFAYVVSHEAWYSDVVKRREVNVQAAARDGGVAWEFAVEEVDLGSGQAIRVKVFDDAFAAFAQVPEFFDALAAEGPKTLAAVISILDRLGARDVTERVDPARRRAARAVPRSVHDALTGLGWLPPGGAR